MNNLLLHLQDRTNSLNKEFSACLEIFDSTSIFTGPSVYFHCKTISMLKKFPDVTRAIENTAFLESLYATLTAWGMHRMGNTKTKLVNFDKMCSSFLDQASYIEELQSYQLHDLNSSNIEKIADTAWQVINNLEIGIGETKIVAGTKALHHLLPNLIPPIDRQYSLQFFYGNKYPNRGEEKIFKEIFPYFCLISTQNRIIIEKYVQNGQGMHTSQTKVIDNAIVGYLFLKSKNQTGIKKTYTSKKPLPTEFNKQQPASEQILWAVGKLTLEGKKIFSRKDVRDLLGISGNKWNASYNPVFQGMRVDQSGGAPRQKYQGIFRRVKHGLYELTDRGTEVVEQIAFIKNRIGDL